MNDISEVEKIAVQLRQLADRLAAPGIGDEEAESLARQAADLAGRGSAELEAELRKLGERSEPEL